MNGIEGVNVSADLDGKALDIGEYGYIGELNLGKALLEARIEPGNNIFGFNVDGNKNVTPRKNWGEVESPQIDRKLYKAKIQIKSNEEGILHTEYAENNIRLIELDLREGNFQTWEIALVSQDSVFFVTVQKVYEGQCYLNKGTILCPEFNKWPQLVQYVSGLIRSKGNIDRLPPISQYKRKEEEINAQGLDKNTGRVIWFNCAQGFGAIITSEGVARVRWNKITREDFRMALLIPKEIVSYERLISPEQTNLRKTSFRIEAVGVRPI